MNRISTSSVNSSFNYTTPAEEAPNHFASSPANSSPHATTTAINKLQKDYKSRGKTKHAGAATAPIG